MDGVVLRSDDAYEVRITLRDGLGNSVQDRFLGAAGGAIEWVLDGPDGSVAFPDPADRTRAVLQVRQTGSYDLTIAADLDGVRVARRATFQAGDTDPEFVTVTLPNPTIDNRSAGVQLRYRAAAADGTSQVLGSGLRWAVDPSSAGTVFALLRRGIGFAPLPSPLG